MAIVHTNSREYVLKSHRVAEKFFEREEEIPSDEEWERLGKPFLWLLKYRHDGIEIWVDPAYGFMRMAFGDEIVIGRNMVSLGFLVSFGDYYGDYVYPYVPYGADKTKIDNPIEKTQEEKSDV